MTCAFVIMIMIIILMEILVKCADGDIFSAIAHLDPLLHAHKSIIDAMEVYLSEEMKRLDTIKTLINNYKTPHNIMEQQPNYMGNPLNAFTLIKRLTTDLQLFEFYANEAYSTFDKNVTSYLPSMEDLEGASSALVRIQSTYKLNVTELSQGVIQGNFSHGYKPYFEKVSPLSSSDLFVLGTQAYADNDFDNAITWLLEALDKFRTKPEDEVVNFIEADIIDFIRDCYYLLGDFTNALHWTEELVALDPDYPEAKGYLDELKNRVIKDLLHGDSQKNAQCTTSPYLELPDEFTLKYYNLCPGSSLPNNVTKALRCYYKSGPEPFLLLARVKVEVLHQDPDLLLFHDVISDTEIDILKQMSIDELFRSTIGDGSSNYTISSYRISKQAWFTDDSSPVVARISQRVADITDLEIESAEELQVVNYGIGGHYEAHSDSDSQLEYMDTNYEDEMGERIATVLFYMSDVEQGGATTFTEFGLTVFPIKNSAIFWMNLLPSGEPDERTVHGGCPVLRGSKWVCTKWIHEFGQELRRPCPKNFKNNL